MLHTPHLRQALVTAIFLSERRDLSHRVRSRIIANSPAVERNSRIEVIEGLITAFERAGQEFQPRSRPSQRYVEAALTKAEQWIHHGVFLVPTTAITAPDASLHDLPAVLFAKGDRSILDQTAACILNSRKPRRVEPTDSWVLATRALFSEAARRVTAFVSSWGTLPYGLVSRLARCRGASLVLVCDGILPFMDTAERTEDFLSCSKDLFLPDQTLFLSPFPPGSFFSGPVRSRERDNLVVALSSLVLVAAVREGGTMEEIVRIACKRRIHVVVSPPDKVDPARAGNVGIMNCAAVARIEVVSGKAEPHPKRRESKSSVRSPQPRTSTLHLRQWPEQGSYLIHYTRSCFGPWPGQSWGDYCQSLIEGREDAAHSGFHTLQRILEEGVIRGSNRLTRGAIRVVSFTECAPAEVAGLIRWRRGLIRWSFEPYGIAVARESLADLGAAPVVYGDDDEFRRMPDERKHLFQLQKTAGTNWSAEREWRVRGDFALSQVPARDIFVIVACLEEAWIVQERFDYEVTLAGIPDPHRNQLTS